MSTIEIEQEQEITPVNIIRIGTGFWSAKPLLTAIRLGLFTELAAGPLFVSEIRQKLRLESHSSLDFLDALVNWGIIERHGKGFTAIYHNSPAANAFLNRRKPDYLGNLLEMVNDEKSPLAGNLKEVVSESGARNSWDLNRLFTMVA
ncbi:methyltransferase family protein [Dyadobacter jiangsuensis]|uniref:Methyltransferase family protein n=1 Tax=Dyadobacter jiangsuensis TaxID=1591085 RepID=A0A2P8G074_9BACT|nr:methyltransferase dimerization domain-containing protein [Dyadobacter jiangsuensis]PSL27372.1 methyltransferase family protein [Dyadobacter jiangsuensis]